jgi:hypothetical protein
MIRSPRLIIQNTAIVKRHAAITLAAEISTAINNGTSGRSLIPAITAIFTSIARY